ncbi:MAG: hypothetical protein JWO19_4206 [Bryobacterales bacterium]|nr:hypothetical protein [Bryobacterales bacterium]
MSRIVWFFPHICESSLATFGISRFKRISVFSSQSWPLIARSGPHTRERVRIGNPGLATLGLKGKCIVHCRMGFGFVGTGSGTGGT